MEVCKGLYWPFSSNLLLKFQFPYSLNRVKEKTKCSQSTTCKKRHTQEIASLRASLSPLQHPSQITQLQKE